MTRDWNVGMECMPAIHLVISVDEEESSFINGAIWWNELTVIKA